MTLPGRLGEAANDRLRAFELQNLNWLTDRLRGSSLIEWVD